MSWVYERRTGYLTRSSAPTGPIIAVGYSGHGEGKNNPDMSPVPNVGPIPPGRWLMTAMLTKTETHGPHVIRLTPVEGTNTFGRSGFLIHGDSVSAPGTASLGCIILPRLTRDQMWQSEDKEVIVL